MIRITDAYGRTHVLHRDAIARLIEASASSQWHGIRTIVKLFDGGMIEASETLPEIQRAIEAEEARP